MTAPEWDLLEKTEVRIEPIELAGADLGEVAAVIADTLGLPHSEVIVIDARENLLAVDILRATVDARRIAGRQAELVAAIGGVPGITVNEHTAVCSQGMLGWISADRDVALDTLARADAMAAEIARNIATRAIVFSTGPEVITGQIRDTNKPAIAQRLRNAGFTVTEGDNLPDDGDAIAAALRTAGHERGYGLVVTTGGVGAEGKDGTVEALLKLDPCAATPALFNVQQGHGRHAKGQVRIGIGEVGTALVVCLPGPHAEAITGAAALVEVLARTREKAVVATEVATVLRSRLRRHIRNGS
jgi:molybdenum cofactor synthesis domain-containing protein